MSLKRNINIEYFFLYLILIPFLYPRGFSEYVHSYKIFFTVWMYAAIICIFLLFLFELSKNKVLLKCLDSWILFYFMVMCMLTFIVQHSFNEGLQKMFASPALCMLSAIYLKKKPRSYIKCVDDLLTLMFILNITVFNPLLWKQYFAPLTNHLSFLGHVQLNAQLGIIGIFFAYINYSLYSGNKVRLFIKIVLSIIAMISSYTSASYIALLFLLGAWIYSKTGLKKIINLNIEIYAYIYFLCNTFLFYFVACKSVSLSVAGFSLNGRGTIWQKALNSYFKSPIYGYGVHGVLVKVFWSAGVGDGRGMNYMHNQILQVLNDGGVILLVPYIFMIFFGMKGLNKLKKDRLRFWTSVCMVIMLFIMTFESVMEHFYVFFMLMTVAYLPEIYLKSKRVKWGE